MQNEIKMPKSLLEELIMRKQAVKDAEQFITEENRKFREKVAKSEAFIEREKREIEALRGSFVSVELEKLVEQVAKEWGTTVDNLEVVLVFDVISGKYEKYNFNEFGKFLHEFFNTKQEMALLITDKHGVCKRCECFKRPLFLLDLKEKQRDGKTLGQHLNLVSTEVEEGKFETTFVCDDYKNLIFNYRLSELLDLCDNPKSSDSLTILKATESFIMLAVKNIF
ncbi:MAG: hypothetical protein IJW36_00090 [Clostridia bacterium]|nr:hypothetical protein [Clostridia bacterium]